MPKIACSTVVVGLSSLSGTAVPMVEDLRDHRGNLGRRKAQTSPTTMSQKENRQMSRRSRMALRSISDIQ
ncbi:hypothetical protein ACHMW7_14225 [Aminobacter sp. UC22_36]|uniref:hypothetical protein n=1 Tax=Aminobacter sp. UC22_36 TaxID=3374549 RepID=UPI0037573A8B